MTLKGPCPAHHKYCARCCQEGMTSGWPEEASSIPAQSWQRLPGPQWLREEAGTGCLCCRLHLEGWVGRQAHSHLYSPHPCPGQAAMSLSGASEGTVRVPIAQPSPTDVNSGRLLMLGLGGEMEQLDPTQPQRGPKSSLLILSSLGAEEVLCRTRSEGKNTL